MAANVGSLGHVVVVGASLAGLRACETLRTDGFAGRITLVGAEDEEGTYLRSRLALAGVGLVDEVVGTETALEFMERNRYVCGVFNLDDHRIDVWSLMRDFMQRNPKAMTLATTELAGPLAGWWRRRRVRRDAHRVGITALLQRPFQPRQVSEWLDLI